MKRIKIWRRGICAAVLVAAGILCMQGRRAEAAAEPRIAGQEETIYLGGRDDISVVGADIQSVTYSSSNAGVVTVNSQGTVIPVKQGQAKIIAKVSYGPEGNVQTRELSYNVKVLDDAAKYFVFAEGTHFSIKELTFRGKALKEIYIPSYYNGKKVERVYSRVLSYNKIVEKVYVGDNVESISFGNYEGDEEETDFGWESPNLREIHIGRDMKYWGELSSESVLEKITVDSGNPYLQAKDDVLYSKAGYGEGAGHLLCYAKGKRDDTYTVPEGISVIRSYAFAYCKYLNTVVLPSTLTEIGGVAFAYSSLTEISIPPKAELGYHAFGECKNLKKVFLPEELKSEGSAFYKCTALETVTLPSTARKFYGDHFEGCSKLQKYQVAGGEGDFEARDGILFQKSTDTLVAYPPGKKDSSYRVPDDVKQIEDKGFYGSKLKTLTLGKSVERVGEYAFYQSKSLGKLQLNKALKNVGVAAFVGCKSLEKIHFYKNVRQIGMSASDNVDPFTECQKLKEISVDSANKYYASVNGALLSKSKRTLYRYPCSRKMKKYVLPKEVRKISERAFSETRYLQSVKMGNGVKKMENYVFRNATGLKTVTLSDKLDDLSFSAFEGCKNLQKIAIPDRVAVIWPGSFSGCKSLRELVIGKKTFDISGGIFRDCVNMRKITFRGKKWFQYDLGRGNTFKKVGSKNYKKLTVIVPKCSKKEKVRYKKILRKHGLHKKAKIKFRK